LKFTEREKWIAITSIMKVSSNSKSLSKDQRDQLFLHLHRTHASSLKDPEIKEIEKDIVDLGMEVQKDMIESLLKQMGTQDKKKIYDEAVLHVGKENTDKVMKLLNQEDDKRNT
jgi:hypothetical protein